MSSQMTLNSSIVAILQLLFVGQFGLAQQNEAYVENGSVNLELVYGPKTANLDNIAGLSIPEGYIFAGKKDAQTIMEYTENPISGIEVGLIAPEDFGWFAIFEFDPIGYVKDDEKSNLDRDAILKSIMEATEDANKERRKRGWGTLSIDGWFKEPYYDQMTHNLEWAIHGVDAYGYRVINYNTRILGRKGVMSATLVCDPDSLTAVSGDYRALLGTFAFNPGQKYAEYVEGDAVAQVGLTALIVGGGAAVAAKSGLFKWLWKLIVLAVAAIGGFFRKAFRRNKRMQPTPRRSINV